MTATYRPFTAYGSRSWAAPTFADAFQITEGRENAEHNGPYA